LRVMRPHINCRVLRSYSRSSIDYQSELGL